LKKDNNIANFLMPGHFSQSEESEEETKEYKKVKKE
jgi:hypothetical protein